ncbi:MAG: cation acetate symporter, partial [Candidatus Hydrogenedentes bacterium]|nr:cation acetate symporter [Candidatus Hydrogenedentota bacterium]
MIYTTSATAVAIFAFFVLSVVGLSFYLGRRGQTAKGYYAAHGQIHWAVNGIAFAGDYLSAASFLGICGLIAFYGFDGFLYSIGYLAGWIVALFVIAEPIKRLGRFTFADALDSRFKSRAIKLSVAISTLVVSVFYLIPQMVGAGALITPLLGLPHYAGVLIVGIVVTLIVVTAGMVSTTWVQFIKGSLLVMFCAVLTIMILLRGFSVTPAPKPLDPSVLRNTPGVRIVETPWPDKPYAKAIASDGVETVYRITPAGWVETQTVTVSPGGKKMANGMPRTNGNDLRPVGTVAALPGGQDHTGPVGPLRFLGILREASVVTWTKEKDTLKGADGTATSIYYPVVQKGADLLKPG